MVITTVEIAFYDLIRDGMFASNRPPANRCSPSDSVPARYTSQRPRRTNAPRSQS